VLLIAVVACEIEKVGISQTTPQIAVHGVLSVTAPDQVVLLERTRTGTVPKFELGDPVMNPLLAETNATVELLTPGGQTLTAVEDNALPANRGQGAGIYRFPLPGDSLVRGGVYRLRVQTAGGNVLTAETRVPTGVVAAVADQIVFDRQADTLLLEWPSEPGARSYLVRVESPYGPRSFFTDSPRVRLTGELRNVDVETLPHVFIPGFPQSVTVSAVDSNYYDWYRSENNALTGTGLIGSVQGGLGFFGSMARLRFQDLRVIAAQSEPAAGMFAFDGTLFERSTTPYWNLELYVESPAARVGQSDALSGRVQRRPFLGLVGCITCGMLGSVRGNQIELVVLRDWFASDTAEVFTGEIRGDTIVGQYRGHGGVARFVRQ
jgi:hypothetical protein